MWRCSEKGFLRRSGGRFVMAGIVLGLSACFPSGGQEAAQPSPESSSAAGRTANIAAPFCLTLVSARRHVLLGEPLTLLARLENCSKTTQRVQDVLAIELSRLAIWMRAPGSEKEVLHKPPIRRESRGARFVELAPGQSIASLAPVYLDASGWSLTRTGPYRFRAEFHTDGSVVRSPSIDVTVANVSDKQLETPARRLMDPSAARFLFLQGGDSEGRGSLESVVREFPESPWAGYAGLSLTIDDAEGLARGKSTSCGDIESATAQVPDWVFAMQGYAALLRCLQREGKPRQAEQLVRRLSDRYPSAQGLKGLQIK
jgi:hypothetical protein